jgi:hypothetical protein
MGTTIIAFTGHGTDAASPVRAPAPLRAQPALPVPPNPPGMPPVPPAPGPEIPPPRPAPDRPQPSPKPGAFALRDAGPLETPVTAATARAA